MDYSFRMLKLTPWFMKYRLYSLLEHHLEFNSSIWISKNTFDIDTSCDSRDGLKSHGLSGSSREEVVNEKIRKLLSRLLVDTLCILIRTIVISLIIVTKWTSVLPKWTSADYHDDPRHHQWCFRHADWWTYLDNFSGQTLLGVNWNFGLKISARNKL